MTAITRENSSSSFPANVEVKRVNYDDQDTLVQALDGQDVLVITLSGRSAFQELETKLIRAAGAAGVPWILPNEWAPDSDHQGSVQDVFLFGIKGESRHNLDSWPMP